MKKILSAIAILIFTVFGLTLYAQDDIQKVQEAWGKDKKELIGMGMELSASDSTKFWPIYNQYEAERQKLGRERIAIINDYGSNYQTMTDGKADEIIKRLFKNEEAIAKLQQQAYSKVKSSLNAIQGAKFLQLESYIQTIIRANVQSELPLIGDLESLKKKQ